MDWPIDRLIDRCIDRWIDGSMDQLIDQWFDRWIDGSINVSMDWWIDRSIDQWMPCRRQRELERVCVWDREWGLCHYWCQFNTFQDIKLCHWPHRWSRNVNINVNNDLRFTLSCELVRWPTIDKYQALEIVYRAHSGHVEGVVGEGKSVSWGGARTEGEVHKRKITNKMFLHSDLLTSPGSSLIPLFLQLENSCCELMR